MEEERYSQYEIKLKNQETLKIWARDLIYKYENNALIITGAISPDVEYVNLNEVIYVKRKYNDMSREDVRNLIKNELLFSTYR